MHLKEGTPPEAVWKFLQREHADEKLLLALSGGPDSLSLFYSLLQLDVEFTVAHVNHGLREESDAEECTLQKMVEGVSIPFYVKQLNLDKGPNLEERAREARYAFFEEVASGPVLLGHHADDQGETLLKRLFEGAPLRTWKGMEPVSKRGKLMLWRPLLALRKKEIVKWLSELDVTPFEDHTNLSDENLRGKFRKNLFPLLQEQFGKEIVPPLLLHQKEVSETLDLLDEMTKPFKIDGAELHIPPLHPAVQKHLIRKWLDNQGMTMAAATLDRLINAIPLVGKRSFPTNKKNIFLLDCKIYF